MRPIKLSKALMCRSLPECVSPPPPMLIKKARDGHGCLLNSGSEGFLALNCMPFLFFRKARTCLPLTSQNMLFEEQLGFCALKCLLFFLRTRDGPFRIFCWLFFGPIHKLLKKQLFATPWLPNETDKPFEGQAVHYTYREMLSTCIPGGYFFLPVPVWLVGVCIMWYNVAVLCFPCQSEV